MSVRVKNYLKSVNIWQGYKQQRGCRMHFARLANTLLKDEESNITYSFIANSQTTVVHKNKTKRRSKIYKSQYIFRYNILTVKLQSVIREMRSGSCLL